MLFLFKSDRRACMSYHVQEFACLVFLYSGVAILLTIAGWHFWGWCIYSLPGCTLTTTVELAAVPTAAVSMVPAKTVG
jgi:hypothetical protein